MVHGTRNEPSKCPWIVLEIHLPDILSKLQWRFLRDCGCGHCKNRQCQNYRHFAPLLKRQNNTSSGKIYSLSAGFVFATRPINSSVSGIHRFTNHFGFDRSRLA
jgi:hypothetical protein